MRAGKIQVKAILLGVATDIAASIIGGTVIVAALYLAGTPADKIDSHPAGLYWGLILGFLGTLAGGLVAGRIAKQSEMLHGGIVGATGFLSFFLPTGPLPFWYQAASFIGVIPAGMAGGFLAKRLPRK